MEKESKFHGCKVAVYPADQEVSPTDFVFKGQAEQRAAPEDTPFREFLQVKDHEGDDMMLGRNNENEFWEEVIRNPLGDGFCIYRPANVYELDIVS